MSQILQTPQRSARPARRLAAITITGFTLAGALLSVAAPAQAIGICAPLTVPVKAMLQGAYNSSALTMNKGLLASGVLPALEPYSALGYRMRGGEANTTALTDPLTNASPVDWVLIELRSATDPTQIVATDTVILGVDGNAVKEPTFSVKPGNYYVAIEHRNHLGVMTAAPVAVGASTALVDFSSPATAVYNVAPGVNGARATVGAVALLHGGEVNHIVGSNANAVVVDSTAYPVAASDYGAIVTFLGDINAIVSPVYSPFDVLMNSTVQATGTTWTNDRSAILRFNGSVDTSVAEQLPVGVLGAASSCAPPSIATASTAQPTVGIFYTQTVSFTGEPTVVLTSTGTLPAGMSFDPATGIISGIPTAAGAYTFSVTATNEFGSDTKNYSGTVLPVLADTGANVVPLLVLGAAALLLGLIAAGVTRRRAQQLRQ